MADLNTDVRYIKGIGEQRAKALGKLGIATPVSYTHLDVYKRQPSGWPSSPCGSSAVR